MKKKLACMLLMGTLALSMAASISPQGANTRSHQRSYTLFFLIEKSAESATVSAKIHFAVMKYNTLKNRENHPKKDESVTQK